MTAADYATAVEVLARAVWIELVLRMRPFSRVLEHVNRPFPNDRPLTRQAHNRLPSFVAAAYELLPLPGTCLRQSLVLGAMLRRRGVPARLCVGVARGEHSQGKTQSANLGALEAHAWVEAEGLEPASGRFEELVAP